MKTVWKYQVGPGEFTLTMPVGAQVLTVQMQNNIAQMWTLVNPDNEQVERHFITVGTGEPFDPGDHSWRYVNTFQVDWMVFHLFEREGK